MKFLLAIIIGLFALPAFANAEKRIVLASTTSTQNSGLYEHLLPQFEEDTGIHVDVIAVGTGQAIRIAKNGDADGLLVHHRASEEAFISQGFGAERFDIMYNDFVFVGPENDRAKLEEAPNLLAALDAIESANEPFVSRGDESGTHKKERELWMQAGLEPKGDWYLEIGGGMGAALNIASSLDGYTLSDRGTWLSFGNKGNLKILWSGDENLQNPYGFVTLNKDRFPHVEHDLVAQFVTWLTSQKGQAAIGAFTVNKMQLFCPNARPDAPRNMCPSEAPLSE